MHTPCILKIMIVSLFAFPSNGLGKIGSSSSGLKIDELKRILRSICDMNHLKPKCADRKALTDHELQCCLVLGKGDASRTKGFSVIKQETQILRFRDGDQQSILKALSNPTASPPEENGEVSSNGTAAHNCHDAVHALHRAEISFGQCSGEKAQCLEALERTKSTAEMLTEQNASKQNQIVLLNNTNLGLEKQNEQLQMEIKALADTTDRQESRLKGLTRDLQQNMEEAFNTSKDEQKLASKLKMCQLKNAFLMNETEREKSISADLRVNVKEEQNRTKVCEEIILTQKYELAKITSLQEYLDRYENIVGTLNKSLNDKHHQIQELETQLNKYRHINKMLHDDKERLQRDRQNMKQRLVKLLKENRTLLQKIYSLEKQNQNCTETKDLYASSLTQNNARLLNEIHTNDKIQKKLDLKIKAYRAEKKARETCENDLQNKKEELEICEKFRHDHNQAMEAKAALLDHCQLQLDNYETMLRVSDEAMRNCSLRPQPGDVEQWRKAYQKCESKHTEEAEYTRQLDGEQAIFREQLSRCQTRLNVSMNQHDGCREKNEILTSQLEDALEHKSLSNNELLSALQEKNEKLLGKLENCNISREAFENETEECISDVVHTNSNINECKQDLESVKASLLEESFNDLPCNEADFNQTREENNVLTELLSACTANKTKRSLESNQRIKNYRCTEKQIQAAGETKKLQAYYGKTKKHARELHARLKGCLRQQKALIKQKETCRSRERRRALSPDHPIKTLMKKFNAKWENQSRACSVKLARFRSEAQLAGRTLDVCAASLADCRRSGTSSCPEASDGERYWPVSRLGGETGCVLLSKTTHNGTRMQKFCRRQRGHLLRINNEQDLVFANSLVIANNLTGKFLVEPSIGFFRSSKLMDASQFASEETPCFFGRKIRR